MLPSFWLPSLLLGAVLLGALLATTAVRGQTHRRAENPHSTRWALLIGVEDYLQLEKLHYCAADMRALRDALVACGFPERQITLLEDRTADKKHMPFKSVIERQLDLILTMADRGDLLIVGFSGHGVHLDGKSYLCPLDARLKDTGSMICVETLYERLARCPAALKIVLADACRDDPRPGGDRSAGPAPELGPLGQTLERPPEGIYCLTSCAPGETSKEDPKLGHGVFMHFVLEGLRGAADVDHRGKVSLLQLCRYATIETKLYVRDKYNESQRPSYRVDATDDFDIGSAAVVPAARITNSIGMKLVLIPAGEFMMGSPESEADRSKVEGPQHRVRITKPFYLGQYPVTLGEFLTFYHDANYKLEMERDNKGDYGLDSDAGKPSVKRPWAPGFDNGNDHPVVFVSWNDAVAFCQWLSKKEGKGYRLPTEAKWEYACRAGSTTRYSFGDSESDLGDYAWYEKNSGSGTHPVGGKRPNGWGLYDMHGNVWQWCADRYGGEYYATSPVDDPQGPDSGSYRVDRGGGWDSAAWFCRSAFRFYGSPGGRSLPLGFRVARVTAE